VPVISVSSRNGEAGKLTAATTSRLAERTTWRQGRNTQFNLKLRADSYVLFSSLSRRPRVTFEALHGLVLDEVGV